MITTSWGYTLTDAEQIPDLLTEEEFDALTAGKYKGDVRIKPGITSAQHAIRNYVGWHLAGSLACHYDGDSEDVARIIQLPARYVTDVSRVVVDGVTLATSEYVWKIGGLIRLKSPAIGYDWSDIAVDYVAGLPDELAAVVKDAAAHLITSALSSSYGVQSESSGGMSVTYSTTAAANAMAGSLPMSIKEILTPYRIVRGGV